MPSTPSRRDVLESLLGAVAWSIAGCRRGDAITRELVCAHVYRPEAYLPPPLLNCVQPVESTRDTFRIGIPELVLCTSPRSLLDLFPYLWPLTRDEFERLRREVVVQWSSPLLSDESTVTTFRRRVQEPPVATLPRTHVVAAVTFTQSTLPWACHVAKACRDLKVSELLVFKDPSVAPYFCDLPGIQRGFRRPPIA